MSIGTKPNLRELTTSSCSTPSSSPIVIPQRPPLGQVMKEPCQPLPGECSPQVSTPESTPREPLLRQSTEEVESHRSLATEFARDELMQINQLVLHKGSNEKECNFTEVLSDMVRLVEEAVKLLDNYRAGTPYIPSTPDEHQPSDVGELGVKRKPRWSNLSSIRGRGMGMKTIWSDDWDRSGGRTDRS